MITFFILAAALCCSQIWCKKTVSSTAIEHFKNGNQLFEKQDYTQAVEAYKHALQEANVPAIQFNLGLCYSYLKDARNAIKAYKRTLQKEPENYNAHLQLAHQLYETEQFKLAIPHYRKIISENKNEYIAFERLGNALHRVRQFREAIGMFKHALTLEPLSVPAHLSLGNTYGMLNDYENAIKTYETLFKKTGDPQAKHNSACAFVRMGNIPAARKAYQEAIAVRPDYANAHFCLGCTALSAGDFATGWKEYEWRFKLRNNSNLFSHLTKPQWTGQDLRNKKILIIAEQGLGDTFQFIRFIKTLKNRGAYTIFATQKPLTTILSHCPYIDSLITLNDPIPQYDIYIPLLSLPGILSTTLETIPTEIPYLHTDETIDNYWKNRITKNKNYKIGICWHGNNSYATEALRQLIEEKSIPCVLLASLANNENITLYNLQKISGINELKNIPDTIKFESFDNTFDNTNGRFMDTASVMKHLDLVITIDTSVAHLAGGLGVPVWVVLPHSSDWRWMHKRTDSPWYPSMKLFRQHTPGDWQSVIADMKTELTTLTRSIDV